MCVVFLERRWFDIGFGLDGWRGMRSVYFGGWIRLKFFVKGRYM